MMPKKIQKQVDSYYTGVAAIKIHLPQEAPYCIHCALGCRYRSAYDSYHCVFTDELLLAPKKMIGAHCPFFTESEDTIDA